MPIKDVLYVLYYTLLGYNNLLSFRLGLVNYCSFILMVNKLDKIPNQSTPPKLFYIRLAVAKENNRYEK